MKKVLLVLIGILAVIVSSCGQSDIPLPSNAGAPISHLSDADLRQLADRYSQKAYSETGFTASIFYTLQTIMYQNELILRALSKE